jgi:hypothetical protein
MILAVLPQWLSNLATDVESLWPIWIAICGLAALGFKGWKRAKSAFREIVQEETATIRHQVLPNGGASLADDVRRTNGKLDNLSAKVTTYADTNEREHEAIWRALEHGQKS